MAKWKAPAPDARDPAGEREEAAMYEDPPGTLRTWARSYHAEPKTREAGEADPEAGRICRCCEDCEAVISAWTPGTKTLMVSSNGNRMSMRINMRALSRAIEYGLGGSMFLWHGGDKDSRGFPRCL